MIYYVSRKHDGLEREEEKLKLMTLNFGTQETQIEGMELISLSMKNGERMLWELREIENRIIMKVIM